MRNAINFVIQSAFMNRENQENSLAAIDEIKRIMERSARFLSLSGWSGIWAGSVALIGAGLAYFRLKSYYAIYISRGKFDGRDFVELRNYLFVLAIATLVFAMVGGVFFTYLKNRKQGLAIWNHASRKMLINLAIPLMAGAVCIFAFLKNNDWVYIGPATLIFYGLALINGSKYTVSDIKYLGLLEIVLGCIGLFFLQGYELYLWAFGFGVLHIVYGIIMWRKYDR